MSDLDEIDSKVINKENIDLIIQVDYEDFIDASVNQLKNSSITRLWYKTTRIILQNNITFIIINETLKKFI